MGTLQGLVLWVLITMVKAPGPSWPTVRAAFLSRGVLSEVGM